MNRGKEILLAFGIVVAIGIAGVASFYFLSGSGASSSRRSPVFAPMMSSPSAAGPLLPSNAFVSRGGGDISLPNEIGPGPGPVSVTTSTPAASGTISPPPSSAQPQNNSVSASSSSISSSDLLTMPDVPDSEMTITASGVSTTLDYLLYFSSHAQHIAFDPGKFEGVLKDSNGIPLFVEPLIEKAIRDDNFSEIQNSLAIQKEFITADISFLRSIPVTGSAVALNREAIGAEELTDDLADNAVAVYDGTMSRQQFIDFYHSFSATAGQLNAQYTASLQSMASDSRHHGDRFFAFSTFIPTALAQGVTTPLGGQVVTIFPAILASIVTIGPPIPAVVIVPDAFIASPLFFSFKALVVGAWWLGIYNTQSGVILMAGTSPPSL